MCEYGGDKQGSSQCQRPSFTQLTHVDQIPLRSTDTASYSILTRPFWSQPESIWTEPKEFVFSPWVKTRLMLHIHLLYSFSQWKQTRIADKLFTWSWFPHFFFLPHASQGLLTSHRTIQLQFEMGTVTIKYFYSQTRHILFARLSFLKRKAEGNIYVFIKKSSRAKKRKQFSYSFLRLSLTGITSGYDSLAFSHHLSIFMHNYLSYLNFFSFSNISPLLWGSTRLNYLSCPCSHSFDIFLAASCGEEPGLAAI